MLSADDLRALCLRLKQTEETFPFGEDTSVFKVMGKMFALMPRYASPDDVWISLKCDPIEAQLLRQTYADVQPGYHLNKEHWNSVKVNGSIPDAEIEHMIAESYRLVVAKLSKKEQAHLAATTPDTNE